MQLKGSDITTSKIFLQYFTDQTKKETIETRSLLETYQNAFYFSTKNIYKPYCFKCHHLKNFAEEIFAIDQF